MINYILQIRLFSLVIYLIAVSTISHGQEIPNYVPLITTNPDASFDDINQIDHYFKNVLIVGMGESTHGTHEFSTMRHRIFKYLVLNHNFNTLFLEADYANCLLANEYVHGSDIDKYKALKKISLWPWMTEEMGDLFDWMRSYNLKNSNDRQLSIIGVDVQQYNSTLTEIDKLLVKNGKTATDTSLYNPITDKEFYTLKKKNIKPYFNLLEEKKVVDISDFSVQDKFKFELLTNSMAQILESKNQEKNRVYRDIKMGENILFHLSLSEDSKGLFWAHNYHIFSIYKQKKSGKLSGYAGGILKAQLGNQYFCIVQEFDEGSFNAYHRPLAKAKDASPAEYTLGVVTIEPSIDNTFGSRFRNTTESILFIDIENLTPEGDKYLFQHTIGAQFIAQKDNVNQTTQYNHCTTGCFDAMILFKESTPTKLIRDRK